MRKGRGKPRESETFIFRPCSTATAVKGTPCFRNFSIGNDLFTTMFTAQMGRGKLHLGVFFHRPLALSVSHRPCLSSLLPPHPSDAACFPDDDTPFIVLTETKFSFRRLLLLPSRAQDQAFNPHKTQFAACTVMSRLR
jgi:hypothetical protein